MKENKKKSWNKIRKEKLGNVPQELSPNLFAPEVAPLGKNWVWNKSKTERLHALSIKIREEFYWELKELALKEKCFMVEILERAFEDYKKKFEEKEKQNKK